MRKPLGTETLAPIEDGERAVEEGVDVDARSSVAAPAWTGIDLKEGTIELHGVVVGDGATILEAADAREVSGCRPPRGLRRGRGVGEARVVAGAETVKDALGLGECRRLREAEFDDQAILEGAKEPLHAALALRRGGGDPADPEFLKRTPDLGRGDIAVELLRQALWRPRIAMKDAMAIGVGCHGQAIAANELAQQQEVAVGILLGAKDASEDLTRGIIDGREEDEARAAILEPGMVAAVHLDEQPGLGHALPPAAMLGWAALARTADASGPEEPLYSFPRHVEVFSLGQQLGEVVIVHAGVGRASQGQNPSSDGFSHPAPGGPSAIAVGHGSGAVLPPAAEQPPEVAQREAQEPRRLPGAQNTVVDARQDMQALVLPLGQGDCLPIHPPRVTDSLTRYGVTKSLTYYKTRGFS